MMRRYVLSGVVAGILIIGSVLYPVTLTDTKGVQGYVASFLFNAKVYAGVSDITLEDNTAGSAFSIKEETTGGTIARFSGDGHVGIGTANPSAKLEISSVGDVFIKANADTDGFDGGPRTISFGVREEIVDGDKNLGFTVRDETDGGAYRLFINKIGNVGIGEVHPGARLDVKGADSLNATLAAHIRGATGTGLVVTNAGDVGIGSNNPVEKLEISSVGDVLIKANADSDGFDGGPRTISFGIVEEIVDGDQNLGFTVRDETDGGADRFFINKVGNVGIGTTNPAYKLDVNGTIRGDNVSPSDMRWKEHVKTLDNSLEKVNKLRGVSFEWKDKTKGVGKQVGLIARATSNINASNSR